MKILVLADLHDDFWVEDKRNPIEGCEEAIAGLDALILAGDLTNKPKVRWKPALRRLSNLLDPSKIFIFPGNHDFYNYRFDAEDRLAEFAADVGVNYVNRSVIHLGSTRFICATLWTDFELGPGRIRNESYIPTRMNDYRVIRHAGGGYRKLMPKDTITTHHQDRKFIEAELSKPYAGQTYVVTHHAPHPSVLADYAENIDAAYASDLSEVFKAHKIDGWLFGHCHDASNQVIHGCPVENVSLGYPMDVENPGDRILSLIRTIPEKTPRETEPSLRFSSL